MVGRRRKDSPPALAGCDAARMDHGQGVVGIERTPLLEVARDPDVLDRTRMTSKGCRSSHLGPRTSCTVRGSAWRGMIRASGSPVHSWLGE